MLAAQGCNPNVVGRNGSAGPFQFRANGAVGDCRQFINVQNSKLRKVFGQPSFVVQPVARVRNAVAEFAQDNDWYGDLGGSTKDGFECGFALCYSRESVRIQNHSRSSGSRCSNSSSMMRLILDV